MAVIWTSTIILFCCIHQATSSIGNGEICMTREGSSGTCIVEFQCTTLDDDRSALTICAEAFLFAVICCPSTKPHSHQYCGKSLILSKIGGGRIAVQNSWPWMTAIYFDFGTGTEFRCGGTVLNDRYIITAAHCFPLDRQKRVSPDKYIVRLAEHNLIDTDKGDEYQIENITIHEEFTSPVQYNDIALIKLRKKIEFNDKVQPICLPVDAIRTQNLEKKNSTVIGWGTTSFAGPSSAVLREVNVPITSTSYCNKAYFSKGTASSYPQGITSSLLCAGLAQGGKDACQGDSGGPLMIRDEFGKWTLVGIISGGFQCARPDKPGIYTRVTEYLIWLAENIQ